MWRHCRYGDTFHRGNKGSWTPVSHHLVLRRRTEEEHIPSVSPALSGQVYPYEHLQMQNFKLFVAFLLLLLRPSFFVRTASLAQVSSNCSQPRVICQPPCRFPCLSCLPVTQRPRMFSNKLTSCTLSSYMLPVFSL